MECAPGTGDLGRAAGTDVVRCTILCCELIFQCKFDNGARLVQSTRPSNRRIAISDSVSQVASGQQALQHEKRNNLIEAMMHQHDDDP
mmetsp:Transcript_97408/g.163738  ORF Transcript_97408/g.163738 Transcript_97408/m.163738 type:complete len:88 (-) Transcript_97408:184-447(-)